MNRKELWNRYWEMVYDSTSVPEEDYEELERNFEKDLNSDINPLVQNLNSIISECEALISEIRAIDKKNKTLA